MKVLIVVYEGDEWKKDTLEARMVDVRIDHLVAEFTMNKVPIQVIRETEEKKWSESDTNVALYPGLRAFRAMRDYLEVHGEKKLLEILSKEKK